MAKDILLTSPGLSVALISGRLIGPNCFLQSGTGVISEDEGHPPVAVMLTAHLAILLSHSYFSVCQSS